MITWRLRCSRGMELKHVNPWYYCIILCALLITIIIFARRNHHHHPRHAIASGCRSRTFKDPNHIVCVCSASYCDAIHPLPSSLPSGEATLYLSSQSGKRFDYEVISGIDENGVARDIVSDVITIDPSVTKQSIIGFGGCFTDATGINIASLSDDAQRHVIESYFGQSGLEYTIGRIPMASNDASTHEYSYDDVSGDFNLTHFALAKEDLQYKIPYIKAAMSASKGRLKLFGTPWSAPGWMKTTGSMKGNGTLIGSAGDQYHKTWANYFVRFIQEYASNDINIWGITVENEPSAGFAKGYTFQALGFTPETQRDFIKTDLGPTLASNNLANVKLMIMDDQRMFIPEWVDTVLNDSAAAAYVSGIAVHWYADSITPAKLLDYAHDNYPQYFILPSEACTGMAPFDTVGPILGDWSRGERYAHDIIEDINHWATGWVDWNLALDPEGRPNLVETFVDSPIIVNKAADEFYKQPMYYALGHFSKFVRPDSLRIERVLSLSADKLDAVAFIRPDGKKVAVVLNRSDKSKSVIVTEKGCQTNFRFNMDARSIATIIWGD